MKKNEKIFIAISAFMIAFFAFFYAYRLIYYMNFKTNDETDSSIKLYDMIFINNDNDLYKDHKFYYFGAECDNNYVLFGGKLFRIFSINENHDVKMIAEENQTVLTYGGTYNESYINKWLNNSEYGFLSAIDQSYLVDTYTYIDDVSNIDAISNNKTYKSKVTLLSLYEYNKAGGVNGYLNNGNDWWLSTTDSTNNMAWYASTEGIAKASNDGYIGFGIRPVISLGYNSKVISGNGTIDSPYQIEHRTIETIADLFVGEKITFNDYEWTVIKKDAMKTKLVLNGYIDDELPFSTKSNAYDVDDKTGIAYYLNNTFYSKLDSKYVKEGIFNNGMYGVDNYDYESTFTNSVTAYVGLLSIGDFYINQFENTFLMNPNNENKLIYTISNEKTLIVDDINSLKKIRPVIYIENTLKVELQGSKYMVGVEQNEN